MRANQWITGASSLALICAAGFAQIAGAQQPQVPIPQTASEVPGPTLGPMTTAYVQTVGRTAYIWGWPLVYVYNQRTELTKVPKPMILNSVPLAPMNQVAMLTNYVSPGETSIADPNQDVVYGLGYLLSKKNPWSFRSLILVTAFGRSRCTTRGPTRSVNLACNTAPSPASTWWWGRTGKATSRPE